VEHALRTAHALLTFDIRPELPMLPHTVTLPGGGAPRQASHRGTEVPAHGGDPSRH
jgi:hypothetical protein